VKFNKRVERYCKRCIKNILKGIIKPVSLKSKDFSLETISRILVIRQDSRLGNLVLMSPLLNDLKSAFPNAEIDVLISEGFEEILSRNPNVDSILVFEKTKSRLIPWSYPLFILNLRRNKYDLAIDVSDGYHFSFNNVLLTYLSGARYRLGYDRGDARSFLNILVPLPPKNTYMSDALLGLAKFISPNVGKFPMTYYLSDSDKRFADKWLRIHNIMDFDSFFAIHPGGKEKKRWGAKNFAALIDRINEEIGTKVVVIGGKSEKNIVNNIKDFSKTQLEVLENVKVGEMAAVIDRCNIFISGDTGPMHVAAALNRPTIGIFISSNFHVYGPHGKNNRIVISKGNDSSCDDVMVAIMDLLGVNSKSNRGTL